VDNRSIDRDTWTGFTDDLFVRGIEFGEFTTIDDVNASWTAGRLRASFVCQGSGRVTCCVGTDTFIWDDCLRSWSGGFFGGLLRVTSCYLGVSIRLDGLVEKGKIRRHEFVLVRLVDGEDERLA
jgi:hypothetical protein